MSPDGPKLTSVLSSPSGEIEEGSSVTLSCSSDANPAANYTWFKVNRDGSSRNMNQGQQLIFKHILSSESGQFRCDTQNEIGERSLSISINVKCEETQSKTSTLIMNPNFSIMGFSFSLILS